MSAVTTRFEPERVRLWTSSAVAALLAHLAIAALLLLHFQRQQPVLHGTVDALDVELLAGPPASLAVPSAAVAQVQQQPARVRPRPQVAAISAVKPLPQIQPIAQQLELQPPSRLAPAAAARATIAAAAASAPAVPDLTVSGPTLGQPNAPPSPEQLWLAQVISQLERYKSYPRSAMKRHQQDTVMLQFTVSHAGQVLSSSVSSQHHYRVLENEVRKMLRLAAPLPALPQQLSASPIVLHVPVDFHLRKPLSVAASCARPVEPGTAPSGAEATLAQMQAYQGRLKQYLAAARSELDCLGGGSEAAALADRQVQEFADRFNAQARAFQAKAAAALKAQQATAARLAQAAAARGYAACTSPSVRRPSAATLTQDTARFYRKQLLAYEAAVRAYEACITQAQLASVAQAGGALTADQRAQLNQTAVQLGNAAILSFNQVAGRFNAQVPHLGQARAAQAHNLPEAVVRGTAIFPSSSWDLPAPLPTDECVYIVESGQTYQAQLCKSSYVTKVSHGPVVASKERNDTPGVAHLLANGFGVGIQAPAVPGEALVTLASSSLRETQMTSYIISGLQVSGTHLILTIDRKSNVAFASKVGNWSSVHFDLVLSTDRRRLVGQCWTAQKRWDCQLSRH